MDGSLPYPAERSETPSKSATLTLDVYRHLFPDELDRLAETLEVTYRAARPTHGVEKDPAAG
jgi:hypothetical protein